MPEEGVPTQEKPEVTVKNTLKILAILCQIFVFCPTFCVSCAEVDINVSTLTAIKGVSIDGDALVKPYPIMLICIILPAVVLVSLWKKPMVDGKLCCIISICGLIDLMLWVLFAAVTKAKAEECYCEFRTTIWFWLNVLAILLLIVISLLVYSVRTTIEIQLKDLLSKENRKSYVELRQQRSEESKKRISSAMKWFSSRIRQHHKSQETSTDQVSKQETSTYQASNQETMNQENTIQSEIGYCFECGNRIQEGEKFCSVCGTKVQ